MSMKLAKERESRVLGISSVGLPIYSISGAEPDGADDETGKAGADGGNGGGNGGDGGTGKEGEPSGDGGDGAEVSRQYTADEYLALERRLKAADEAKGKFEKRLNEIDQATLSETEKLKQDLAKAQEQIVALETEKTKAKMANAILQFPGYTWHDPEVVLQVVDMDLIEFDDETGKVKGVKGALDKLAKEKPYLLKGKTSGSGGSGSGTNNGAGTKVGSSGHSPNGEGRPDDKNAQRKALAKKYKL
jgi:hypothetical protein